MKRAVALISGGLDSILAARLVMDQGFSVTGVYFTSVFSKSYGNERQTHAASVAKSVGIDLQVIDLGTAYVDVIREPKHGYGKNINPCIDCKIHMLRRAAALMTEIGSPFLVTGEVLGQRPMSQRRDALHVIERDSGLRGRILRPLSAALLPPTQAESDGLIDRSRLLGINGRSRVVQLRLADRYGIAGFSTPAGGCLLTDKNFADKLRDLFDNQASYTTDDIKLLTLGRHFKLDHDARIVLGRNRQENDTLCKIASCGHHLFQPEGFPGPVALLVGTPTPELKQAIGRLIITYSKKIPGASRTIRFGSETFDPGTPLPLGALGFRRVGADN